MQIFQTLTHLITWCKKESHFFNIAIDLIRKIFKYWEAVKFMADTSFSKTLPFALKLEFDHWQQILSNDLSWRDRLTLCIFEKNSTNIEVWTTTSHVAIVLSSKNAVPYKSNVSPAYNQNSHIQVLFPQKTILQYAAAMLHACFLHQHTDAKMRRVFENQNQIKNIFTSSSRIFLEDIGFFFF